MDSGGTMPPIITAAITSERCPLANAASVDVPNRQAALLKGPPISMAIIAASSAPNATRLSGPRVCSVPYSASFSAPTKGLIRHMKSPTIRRPATG